MLHYNTLFKYFTFFIILSIHFIHFFGIIVKISMIGDVKLPRGKHSKSKSIYSYHSSNVKQPKLKKSIFVVMFSVVVLGFTFNNLSCIQGDSENNIFVINCSNSNSIISNDTTITSANIENPEASSENSQVQIIKPTEDEKVKLLVQSEIENNNLTKENFAFFYYKPVDKKYYFYNEDTYFTAASTVKVPVAMHYYDMINDGKLTLNSTIKYDDSCYEPGGGTTSATYDSGDNVPISFLLKQSIVNSDNTAVNLLIDNLGFSACRKSIAEFATFPLSDEFYTENVTCARYSFDVINHIFSNQEAYSNLIEDMKVSSMGQYLKKYISDYEVAHKYGSYSGYVHDYGIVFTESPYLIGVFTKGLSEADEFIANISQKVLQCVLDESTEITTNN